MTLDERLALIEEAHRASVASPLSVRKAMLVAVLLDHFADQVFEAFRVVDPGRVGAASDVLEWRAMLVARCPALAVVFALGGGGAVLRVETVEVPISAYGGLAVEDYMVSLYNGNSVQRVMVAWPDGRTALVQDALVDAVSFWRAAEWRASVCAVWSR